MTDDTRSSSAEDDAGGWLEEFGETQTPSDPPPALDRELIRIERLESATRLVVGGFSILAGLTLFGLGFSELVAWGFEGLGVSAKIQTCAAGILVAVIGLLVIAVTRPKIRITPLEDADETRR